MRFLTPFPLSVSEQSVKFSKHVMLQVNLVWFGFNPSHFCVKHNYTNQRMSKQIITSTKNAPTVTNRSTAKGMSQTCLPPWFPVVCQQG